MSVPNAADSARQWIERDATDPYSGGYIGPLMQGLLDRIEALEEALRSYQRAYGLIEETPKTYEVIGSLYAHECAYRCDSAYAANCNCAGACPIHSPSRAKLVRRPAERKNQHVSVPATHRTSEDK